MTMERHDDLSPVKRALLEIRDLRARLARAEAGARAPIAIVGAGLRLPGGVDDLDDLWSLLAEGRDAIVPVPADRWDLDTYYDADADAAGRMTTRHGGFLDRIDRFDTDFFGIAPREAEHMDPQQRLLLETTWHALDDAGIDPSSLYGSRTGVFIGIANVDYGRMLFAHPERIDPYFSQGTAGSIAAGRLSYVLGTHGPSVAIDTACSSSLVAVHAAVQSLRLGECDVAIAGGVNLILSPEVNITFSKARMMAADGRCKTFDAAADGYVRGEGCGVVVLRRLADCPSSGRVLAVIRGSAINQDGRSAGLTAPNGPSQDAVIRAAVEAAGVTPGQIGYVETHGTGTPLGDPIEVQAIASAIGTGREAGRPLPIGSIKTNIGHLEAAAGIAGLLKVVVALQHREIPAHLHCRTPNPHIDWASMPVVVATARQPWPSVDGRWIAGVSAFGFSGTNAHVIVEAPPARQETASSDLPIEVLTLSARTPEALADLAKNGAATLRRSDAALSDLCYTSHVGRAHFAQRVSVRGTTAGEMADALDAFSRGERPRAIVTGTVSETPSVAFLFTGGGAQSVGMARGLYAHAPVFRDALDAAARILDPLIGRPLADILATPGIDTDATAPIHETRFGQPALVAVEIALAALWRSWGIVPSAVLGHSLGEYAAAHVAGILSLEETLRLVVERTRCVDSLTTPGAMATIGAPAADVEMTLARHDAGVSIAAYNGPEQVVVSGTPAGVDTIAADFEARGVRVSRLRVTYASHSAAMDPILDRFEQSLADVAFTAPHTTFVSNVTGAIAGLDVVGRPAYWREHLRRPVRFEDGVRAVRAIGCMHFIEIGPHPVLLGMAAACLPPDDVTCLPSLRREEDDWDVILESLQSLYAAGAPIDWASFDRAGSRRLVAWTRYPFRQRRCWPAWLTPATARTSDGRRAWLAVRAALARQADRGPIGIDLTDYARTWTALEQLTVALTSSVLRASSVFTSAGDRAIVEQVIDRIGAVPSFGRLIGRWLERLVAHGLLRREPDGFVADRPLPEPLLAAAWDDVATRLRDNAGLLDYVRHAADLLPGVIRGTQSPLDTLFPRGAFDLADGLYRRSATMRYVNDLAACAVEAFAAARGDRPIRVLEIGAGTGGTTAALLPCLAGHEATYLYTDVSSFFFDRARAEFTTAPGLRFAELDLDRDLAGQGFDGRRFDLVVASNAVHACRDLAAAIDRIRSLVAPGGLLLLVESTQDLAWFDITTGLIEGWQHFADDLRTDSPLLPADTWIAALKARGFDDAAAWPSEGSAAAALGQHVIVASAGGAAGVSDSGVPADDDAAEDAQRPGVVELSGAARRQQILAALPDERLDLLRQFVRDCVVRILKLDPTEVPGRQARLMDLGLDSLMAVQLRNQLGIGLGFEEPLPATLMFDRPTIEAIAADLLVRVTGGATSPTPATDATVVAAAEPVDVARVAAMTDAEIEALLLSRIEKS